MNLNLNGPVTVREEADLDKLAENSPTRCAGRRCWQSHSGSRDRKGETPMLRKFIFKDTETGEELVLPVTPSS